MSYQENRAWSDRYLPCVKQIVGPLLLDAATVEVDRTQATDLVVLRAALLDIGVRVRRPDAMKWPNDFTIRTKVRSGRSTELEKVANGWMDWMFYGVAGPEEVPNLPRWMLVDMNIWRRSIMKVGWDKAIRLGFVSKRQNPDGSEFIACDIRKYPNCLLIARSEQKGGAHR